MPAVLHATPDVTAAPPVAARRRDPWFDNAKMLLVTLVVVGHAWTLLPDTLVSSWLYDFLYLWHVPAFVVVTGYLSRSFTWSGRNLRRLVTAVALPYLLFEAAMAGFRTGVGGEQLDQLFLDPHWPMWYLATLFLWRLVTPVLRRIPAAAAVAVLVCLLGGLTSGDPLDTARAMGLLPFFVLGLLARPDHLEMLRRPGARRTALALMGAGTGLAAFTHARLDTEWLYWRSSYAELGVSSLEGMAIRLALLVACGALAVSFFALVPRRGGWFSAMGAATLVVYLFHGFVVRGAEYAGLSDWAASHPLLGLPVATAGAVLVALCLAWPPVAGRLDLVVDPVGALARHRAARRTGGRSGRRAPAGRHEEAPGTASRFPGPPASLPDRRQLW